MPTSMMTTPGEPVAAHELRPSHRRHQDVGPAQDHGMSRLRE
jgi:hypothetical protein